MHACKHKDTQARARTDGAGVEAGGGPRAAGHGRLLGFDGQEHDLGAAHRIGRGGGETDAGHARGQSLACRRDGIDGPT